MGLEYMKHKETARHNIADEGIKSRTADIAQQDADTRSYVASFKPQEVDISRVQAEASKSQADTAADRFKLDAQYRERETAAKEDSARAQLSQAETAKARQALEELYRERDTLVKEIQAAAATSQALSAQEKNDIYEFTETMKYLSPANAAIHAADRLGLGAGTQFVYGLNKVLSDLLGNFKVSVR